MSYYSKRHYRLVSPPADTAADLVDRQRRQEASRLGRADREAQFPVLTATNAGTALEYQEARIAWHLDQLRKSGV